jgi:hypothetical protein
MVRRASCHSRAVGADDAAIPRSVLVLVRPAVGAATTYTTGDGRRPGDPPLSDVWHAARARRAATGGLPALWECLRTPAGRLIGDTRLHRPTPRRPTMIAIAAAAIVS